MRELVVQDFTPEGQHDWMTANYWLDSEIAAARAIHRGDLDTCESVICRAVTKYARRHKLPCDKETFLRVWCGVNT